MKTTSLFYATTNAQNIDFIVSKTKNIREFGNDVDRVANLKDIKLDFNALKTILEYVSCIKDDKKAFDCVCQVLIEEDDYIQSEDVADYAKILQEIKKTILLFFIIIRNKNIANQLQKGRFNNTFFLVNQFYVSLANFMMKNTTINKEQEKEFALLLIKCKIKPLSLNLPCLLNLNNDLANHVKTIASKCNRNDFGMNYKFLVENKDFFNVQVIKRLLNNCKELLAPGFRKKKQFKLIP